MGVNDQIFRFGSTDIDDRAITGIKQSFEVAKDQHTYFIFIDTNDANLVKARNGTTGIIDHENADASIVFQAVLDAIDTAGKGTIRIGAGSFEVGNLTSNAHLRMLGQGKEETELKLKNATNGYILTLNSDLTTGSAGGHYRCEFHNIKFDGNRTAQTTTSGCVKANGTIETTFFDCHFEYFRDYGVFFHDCSAGVDPFSNDNFGHHNRITNCLFDQSEGSAGEGIGVYMRYSDENVIALSEFQYNKIDIKDEAGFNTIEGNAFVDGEKGVYILDSWRTRVANNVFDKKGHQAIWLKGYRNAINSNTFYNISDGNANTYPIILIDYYGTNSITGNIFCAHETNGVTKYYIEETGIAHSTGGQNAITGNIFEPVGTLGSGELSLTTTSNAIIGNTGLTAIENKVAGTSATEYTLKDAPVLLEKFTLSATTTAQTYTLSALYDYYEIFFDIDKGSSTGNGSFAMRFNSVATGYKQQNINYASVSNPNTTAFKFCGDTTGTPRISGRVSFNKVGTGSVDNVALTGTAYASDQFVWLGGRCEVGADVTSITFDDFDSDSAFTGTITIYGRRAIE